MQRYKIVHRTYYNFSGFVQLEQHALRLRPRESHELHIESSSLTITPAATLRWQRDVENNSVAIATFTTPTNQLTIESEVIIQQFNEEPLDFLVADYAINYPFSYTTEDKVLLAPYMQTAERAASDGLPLWLSTILRSDERLQTYALLQRLSTRIHQDFTYQITDIFFFIVSWNY